MKKILVVIALFTLFTGQTFAAFYLKVYNQCESEISVKGTISGWSKECIGFLPIESISQKGFIAYETSMGCSYSVDLVSNPFAYCQNIPANGEVTFYDKKTLVGKICSCKNGSP